MKKGKTMQRAGSAPQYPSAYLAMVYYNMFVIFSASGAKNACTLNVWKKAWAREGRETLDFLSYGPALPGRRDKRTK